MQSQMRRAKAPATTQANQITAPPLLKEIMWPETRRQTPTPLEGSTGSSLPSGAIQRLSSPSSRSGGGDSGNALVVVETYYSPLESPLPVTPPTDSNLQENVRGGSRNSSLVLSLGRVVSEKTASSALVVGSVAGGGVNGGALGFGNWKKEEEERVVEDIVSRSRRKGMVMKAALGLRVYELVLSLVSFSVMAADNTQGWSGDSFYRYKEYKYCLSVNVIAFAYAAFQAFNITYRMLSGKHFINHHLLKLFNFIMDQILAYLLISASSAAATRVDEWQTHWGKDEFTEKASISTSMSFLAFAGFALSSAISGHNLCNRDFT